ncbi:MAG TPA: SRPBCC domain-containing protein [Terriglobales bacterium]|nr:SRPBCC domain-containing protein [Terriglobales bacterium]
MIIEGSHTLSHPCRRVWDFISDPNQIVQCLPETARFEIKNAKSFTVISKVKIAFLSGTFKLDFNYLEQVPPSRLTFEAVGEGLGVFIRLNTVIDLKTREVSTTELKWKTDAEVGGILAELPPTLIQAGTDNYTRRFFECVKSKLDTTRIDN